MTPKGDHETRLWLVRHPEPEASVTGRCYGSLDVELSTAGYSHARTLAESLATEPLTAIFSSPLQRCRQAGEILAAAKKLPLELMEDLREMHFGDLEGLRYEEIAAQYPDLYRQWMENPTEVRFPAGESFAEMRARVIAAFGRVRQLHSGQSVAIVTHGGVIRIILAEVLGTPPSNLFRIGQRYGGVNLIRYFGDAPVVELLNAPGTR